MKSFAKVQGVDIHGGRPITKVNAYGNHGKTPVDKIKVVAKGKNFIADSRLGTLTTKPIYGEIRLPQRAITDLLENYELSKETKQVLQQYNRSDQDMVISFGKHDHDFHIGFSLDGFLNFVVNGILIAGFLVAVFLLLS